MINVPEFIVFSADGLVRLVILVGKGIWGKRHSG